MIYNIDSKITTNKNKKITRVNTKTADAIERTFQTTSAHTTKRIKMEWGWGRLTSVTLVNHLRLSYF